MLYGYTGSQIMDRVTKAVGDELDEPRVMTGKAGLAEVLGGSPPAAASASSLMHACRKLTQLQRHFKAMLARTGSAWDACQSN